MAHEFYIKTTSGEFVTYTDYDAIDLTTLKHVIKFLPELGTLVDSHEILLETGTLNASAADGVITEEDNSVTATDGTTYAVPAENKLLLEDNGQIMYENAALNPLGKLVPEQFTDGVALVDDISLASFVRVSDSVPDNDVRDVKFNNDGTKMFVLGRANDNVYEYSVATAWNVSSITLVRTLDISVVSSTQGDNAANGIEFNNDGTKMFILGQGQDLVNEYALSTGFDLSTASFTQSLDISAQENLPYGVTFNNDGTKMYITGWRNDNVNEYVLTKGFDISTASYSQTFSVSDQAVRPSGVRFNSDGTKMYVLEGGTTGEGHNTIYQYALTTAFDVSTASYSGLSASVIDVETRPRGFCFGDNGTQLYVAGWTGDDINQYTSLWPKRATGGTNDARDVDGDGDVDVRSTDGLENHLVLETAPDSVADDHYHLPVGHHHEAGDGHTAEEHRELQLWNYKLKLLIDRERLNNA